MLNEFRNEPFTDFTQEANAQAMRDALAQVRSELGREYPLVIGGERISTEDFLPYSVENAQKLTDFYTELVEKMICEQPENWLWTHRRWKHQPKEMDILSAKLQVHADFRR